MHDKCGTSLVAVINNKGIGNSMVGRSFCFWKEIRWTDLEPTPTRTLEGRGGEEERPTRWGALGFPWKILYLQGYAFFGGRRSIATLVFHRGLWPIPDSSLRITDLEKWTAKGWERGADGTRGLQSWTDGGRHLREPKRRVWGLEASLGRRDKGKSLWAGMKIQRTETTHSGSGVKVRFVVQLSDHWGGLEQAGWVDWWAGQPSSWRLAN